MKVLAIVGSSRKKHTYDSVFLFLKELETHYKITYEIIMLSDYNLQTCKGCKLCIDKGEETCPLQDDRDLIISKIQQADGLILASPNYSFHVSGLMKVFLDRLGYFFHRPEFFSKTFTSIVTQGIYGGNTIVKYFNFIGNAMGFNIVKGSCMKTLEPLTDARQKKNVKLLKKQAKKYYNILKKFDLPKPSFFDLMIFRLSRTSMKKMLNEEFRDYTYYKEKGWFESDFFYPTDLNPVKKIFGKLFDFIGSKVS